MAYYESFLNKTHYTFTRDHDLVAACTGLIARGFTIHNVYMDSKFIYFEVSS